MLLGNKCRFAVGAHVLVPPFDANILSGSSIMIIKECTLGQSELHAFGHIFHGPPVSPATVKRIKYELSI